MYDNLSLKVDALGDSYFVNSENVKLFEQIWYPKNSKKIRALVFIIHGLNEHSSFYYQDTVVQPLLEIGCMVVTHDHEGHGKSEGDRDMVGSVENLARDVLEHIEEVRGKPSIPESIPIFLYGHSLGGLIACMISLDRPEMISGMILEAPALCLESTAAVSWPTFMVTRLLSMFVPSWVIRKPKFTNLSRNQSIIQAARDDEFRNKNGLTWGSAINLTNAVVSIQPLLRNIKTPFMTVHGNNDTIVSVEASKLLMKVATTKDKCIHIYDDVLHLVRADMDDVNEEFKNRMVQWIHGRLK